MTLSLPFPALLLALLTGNRPPAAAPPAEAAAPPQNDHLRRDLGLPEATPPSALALALRARGDL